MSADDKPPEPHPLPLTRQWVEVKDNPPPDLQELVEQRYAASIGEKYVEDPFKRPPHQGGYQHITAEEWAEYDRAMAAWQAARRKWLQLKRVEDRRRVQVREIRRLSDRYPELSKIDRGRAR
jgi:hypothetical protein